MFSLLGERGVWAVPRSGLLFRRRGGKLVLFALMPPVGREGFGIEPPEGWDAYRKGDLAVICATFTAAGIEVVDESGEE